MATAPAPVRLLSEGLTLGQHFLAAVDGELGGCRRSLLPGAQRQDRFRRAFGEGEQPTFAPVQRRRPFAIRIEAISPIRRAAGGGGVRGPRQTPGAPSQWDRRWCGYARPGRVRLALLQ